MKDEYPHFMGYDEDGIPWWEDEPGAYFCDDPSDPGYVSYKPVIVRTH